MTTNKQKILFLITKSNWGGAQRQVFDLAVNLPKTRFEVVVAAGGLGILHEKLHEAGIRSVSIDTLARDIKASQEALSFITFWRLIKNERPDIVHLHSPKAGGLGALAARLHNFYASFLNLLPTTHYPLLTTKIIYTAHGWPFNEDRSAIQKYLIRLASWLTILLTDQTIVISDRELKQIRNFLFVQHKIIRIYNGIDSKIEFRERIEARKMILGDSLTGPQNLWVGIIAELHKNKGLDFAIEAWSEISLKYKGIKLVIIGEGEERKNLEKKIELSRLNASVFLVGKKDNAATLLKAFDVFLLPSVKEGLPYVILEAGAAELPVVATSVGGLVEIIDDMKSGILIQSKHPKEIAKAVSYLIDKPESASKMAYNLKGKVAKVFTLKKMFKETYNLYGN